MLYFKVGQVFEVRYSSATARKKYGYVAGTCQIVGINRDESAEEWKPGCIRGCYNRGVGTIEFILNTDKSHNGKVKTARLVQDNNSQEYADKFCNGIREYEWFLPTKRDYYCIGSDDKQI